MSQDWATFLSQYRNMYAGYGVCTLWFLGSLIYTLHSQYLLSRLRSKLLEATITNVFQHWQGSIDIMVLLNAADYHYIVQRYAKSTGDILGIFINEVVRLFVPLLIAYLAIMILDVRHDNDDCYFVQGLFFLRALYPVTQCSWSVTVYHSNIFFGMIVVTLVNLLHLNARVSVIKLTIWLYVGYICLHFALLSSQIFWGSREYNGAYAKQSPFDYFFDYLHGILEIEFNFNGTNESLALKSKAQPKHRASQAVSLLHRSVGDILFVLIWCLVFLCLIPLNIISGMYETGNFLKISIGLFGRPLVVFFNQLFMHLLLYDKTLIFQHIYANAFLIEVGENAGNIVLAYAISGYFSQRQTNSVQLGPNNLGVLFLYLTGYGFKIFLFAHAFKILQTHATHFTLHLFDAFVLRLQTSDRQASRGI